KRLFEPYRRSHAHEPVLLLIHGAVRLQDQVLWLAGHPCREPNLERNREVRNRGAIVPTASPAKVGGGEDGVITVSTVRDLPPYRRKIGGKQDIVYGNSV